MEFRGHEARGLDAGEAVAAAGRCGRGRRRVQTEKTLDRVLQRRLPDLARRDDPERAAPAHGGILVGVLVGVLVQQRQTGEDAGFEDARHVFPGTGAVGPLCGRTGELSTRRLELADQWVLAVAGDEEGVVVRQQGLEVWEAELGGFDGVGGRVDGWDGSWCDAGAGSGSGGGRGGGRR